MLVLTRAEATMKSTALMSKGSASPRTMQMSMCFGISMSRSAIDCRNVN